MFESIDKLIKDCYSLTVEEVRYGEGILLGLDDCFSENEIEFLIDVATSPGDTTAMEAADILEELSKNSQFLYARGKTFGEALENLEERAKLWNETSGEEQKKIIATYQEKVESFKEMYDCK